MLAHTSRTGRYVTDEKLVIELAAHGFLKDHGPQRLADGMHYFTMREAGRTALAEHRATLPKPKPLTRSQRRYQEYLSVCESFDSFHHWLIYTTRKNKMRFT